MKKKHLSNTEIRTWYNDEVGKLPKLIKAWEKAGVSLKERADRAWKFRRDKRLKARAMMRDRHEVEMLEARDNSKYGTPDGPTFQYLLNALKAKGLKENEALEELIEMSSRTDASVDKKLGI